jgi:hypothetical protein
MEVRREGELMDLESARRVANLEAANPGFKYQLVEWTDWGLTHLLL